MQLIDGGMMAFAAFHAMKDKVRFPLTHMMPLMLLKLVTEAQDTFAVCWDAEKLWKRDRWPAYRNRPEIWDAAGKQDFDDMFAVLNSLGVLQFRAATLEADESLAALVHALDGTEPLLVRSDDKDFMQLLSPSTWMYGRVRGVVKPEHVPGILGVTVDHVADLLALTGDKVDGIPSLAASSTALRIIHDHGHVRDWLNQDIADPTLRKLLDRVGEQLCLNYELVDLSLDAVGAVPNANVRNYGDRQTAKDVGTRLGIEHLVEPDERFAPLLSWGMRTVEQLLEAGHIQ